VILIVPSGVPNGRRQPAHLAAEAGDADRYRVGLRRNAKRMLFFGLSVGGVTGYTTTVDHPDLAGVPTPTPR
jgi:hypothetical protein